MQFMHLCFLSSSIYTPFHEETNNFRTKAWRSIANAFILIAVVIDGGSIVNIYIYIYIYILYAIQYMIFTQLFKKNIFSVLLVFKYRMFP